MEEEFKPKGYDIPTLFVPNFVSRIFGYFDKSVKFVAPYIGKCPSLNNDRFLKELEIEPISYEKSIIEMAYDMIEKGYVPKKF